MFQQVANKYILDDDGGLIEKKLKNCDIDKNEKSKEGE